MWCENSEDFSIEPDFEHSPKAIRVNDVAINSKEFSHIWNCSDGTKMNPKEKKCRLW